ncbi:MAG: hypothetical protein Crog4KO_35330 [Crocinitomicaceae bacterium]
MTLIIDYFLKGKSLMVKILVVEDETDIRKSIIDMLELDNHDVIEASDGKKGMALALENSPDLIISDVMMPGMNGHDFFAALKEHLATAHIPFIFLTALVSYEDVRDGMNLGADDYLAKPFNYQQLSHAVNTRLNKQAFEERLRLRQFAQQLVALQERERKTITKNLETDIQEPLNSLKMMLNLALQSQDLTQMATAAQLVEDISAETQNLSLRLSPTMIEQLNIISALTWLVEQYKQRHQLNIRFERSGFTPILSNTRKMGVYRIFDEILTNITQHAHANEIKLWVSIKEDRFFAEIRDDGIGFDIYEAMQGNTIGLRSLFERSALLEGTLDIQSIKNDGTHITLEIPVEVTNNDLPELHLAQEESASHNLSSRLNKQVRVIVADDHDLIRHGLRQLFSQDESILLVGEVATGIELLQITRQQDADVVLIDMMLEDSSGFEMIRAVKQQNPTIQIIAFSNYTQEVYAVEALQSGAKGYLLKNIHSLEIISAIHKVARGEKYICEVMADNVMNWIMNTRTDENILDIYQTLTSREREIMLLVVDGLTSNEVAEKLAISPRTVEKHRSNFMTKLDLKTTAQLMRFALEYGIIGK